MNPFSNIAETIKDAHWMERAACSPLTAELFWPDPGGTSNEGRAICSGCEVRRQCAQYAIDNGEKGGIWGGMTVADLKSFKPERPANECPNGHNLDEVGTRSNGYCRQCDRDRYERYRERQKAGLVAPRKRKRRQVNPTNPEAHGLYRHNLGCRCLICCNANADKQRKIRERKRMRRSLSIVRGGVA